jgi:hypothetical protein
MSGYFMLEGKTAVEADSLQNWSRWFFMADREVARTESSDGAVVKTEFVGVDQRSATAGETPLLFETRTFDAGWRSVGRRCYATWTQAEIGHIEEVFHHNGVLPG